MHLVSHQHEFVLVTIPKNACVTMRYLFHYLEQGRLEEFEALESRPPGNIHVECRRLYGDRAPGPHYKVWTVLRNPWSRVVSAHADKVARAGWLSWARVSTLSEFVRFLETAEVESSSCDQHWRAQHTFLDGADATILRVERLQEGVDAMLEEIGLPPIRLPNWKAGLTSPRKEHLSPGEAEVIGRLYARDVALSGAACPDRLIDPLKPEPSFSRRFELRCQAHRLVTKANFRARKILGRHVW